MRSLPPRLPVNTIHAIGIVRISARTTNTSIMALKRRQISDHVTCKHCRKDYRAITVLHLRNIHGYEGEHPINDYKRTFRLKSATCVESRKKISVAKEGFWAKRGQHWTTDTLLAEIRKRIPVRLYEAGRRFFGTWQEAVQKAGLNYEEATGIQRWTPAKVVEAIRKLSERGVPLSASYVERRYQMLFNVAVRQFPRSWRKALRAAGLDPEEHKTPRGKWNRQGAEGWIRTREAKGKSILARDAPRDLVGFVHRRLGIGWADFVESLGIPYPGIRKCRDWTKVKLLEEIREWKAEGHRLNYRAVASKYQALIHQARKFFGSWDRARAAAEAVIAFCR